MTSKRTGPAAPRRGRPPSGEPQREEQVQLRLTTVERGTLQDAADRAGVPLSTWIREMAVEAARRRIST